jgi:hypothetical protein
MLPVFAVLEAFWIPFTTGMVNPFPSETTIIPSAFVTLYPDIQRFTFQLYITVCKI